MRDYSKWPNPFTEKSPLHDDGAINNFACQVRGALSKTAFDPRCDECVTAAVGYLDAGQTIPYELGMIFFPDGRLFNVSLQDFVEWVNYYKRVKV